MVNFERDGLNVRFKIKNTPFRILHKISVLHRMPGTNQATKTICGIDKFYIAYFLIHIPITLIIDSCIIIPEEQRFQFQKQFLEFHISSNKDFLLVSLPLWLKVFGLFELFVQLPFFAIGAYMLMKQIKQVYPCMLIYGFNASFTTLVCLVHILCDYERFGLTTSESYKLAALYIPYLVIPLVMLVDYSIRINKSITTHIPPTETKKNI